MSTLPQMGHAHRVLRSAAFLVAAIILAACSGDDDDSGNEDDLSPLEEYLGEGAVTFEGAGDMSMSLGGDQAGEPYEPSEEELQQQRDVEDFVAQCMADEGFEYVPYVPSDEDFEDPFADAYSLPDDEFAEKYGYGASTLMYVEEEGKAVEEDPNQKVYDSLSPKAQEAYDAALYGAIDEDSAEWTSDESEAEPDDLGCYGEADEKIYNTDEASDPYMEFESLVGEDISRIGERVYDDSRVVEATEKWQACMADAGYPDVEKIGDPEQQVYQRMSELEGWDDMEGTEGDGAEEFEPDPIAPADLEKLKEFELTIAKADFDCMEEHVNEIVDDVQIEVEEKFVEEHRDELEKARELIAEMEDGR